MIYITTTHKNKNQIKEKNKNIDKIKEAQI